MPRAASSGTPAGVTYAPSLFPQLFARCVQSVHVKHVIVESIVETRALNMSPIG